METGYAEQYGRLYAHHWWWRARESYVLRWIRRVARGRRLRMFEVGCGDGFLWTELEPYGEVEGIEPDEHLIRPDSPWRSRIEIATFPGRLRDATYDLVLMLDALEHIEDDAAALRAASDLLAPAGHVILTVPAMMLLWSEFDVVNRHFRRYDRKRLVRLLREAGLNVVSARYYYFWPVLPLLARRLLFRSEGAEKSAFLKIPARPINFAIEAISKLEHRITSVVPVPFGSSIIAVARKPAVQRLCSLLKQVNREGADHS
jgi:SAM-dependent methyltransferase